MDTVKTRVDKVLQGRVVSNKMQKTIVVEIVQRKLHNLYKKYLTRTKRLKVHDENNSCGIGDTVRDRGDAPPEQGQALEAARDRREGEVGGRP